MLFCSLLSALGVMWLAWLVYLISGNSGVVDIFWAIACLMVGATLYIFHGLSGWWAWFVLSCLVVWAVRLSGFLLLTRIMQGHRDPRYEALSHGWRSKSWGFLFNYTLQAVLAWLIAMPPLYFALSGTHVVLSWQWLGVIVFSVGLIGEAIADGQLRRFKLSGQSGICEVGLWRFSRHPNYFFEWLIWLGFAFMGLTNWLSLLGFIGPFILFSVMFFVTGPMTERQSLKKHGKRFSKYQERTSYFFPTVKHQES